MLGLLALNPLNKTDIIFFVVIAAIIVLCIGVYFLIPVINQKQYKEMRENLKKREVAFKSNVQRTDGSPAVFSAPAEEDEQDQAPADDESIEQTEPIELIEDEEK